MCYFRDLPSKISITLGSNFFNIWYIIRTSYIFDTPHLLSYSFNTIFMNIFDRETINIIIVSRRLLWRRGSSVCMLLISAGILGYLLACAIIHRQKSILQLLYMRSRDCSWVFTFNEKYIMFHCGVSEHRRMCWSRLGYVLH